MRKYKIINPRRFIIAITTLIASVILIISSYSSETCKSNYEVCEVIVCEGDTLWNIASIYADESIDVRDYIQSIMCYNDMTSPCIMPGDIINIPLRHKKREAAHQ